jgi:transposase
MDKVNNQNFEQIPFSSAQFTIKYLCEREGIAVIEQEESYTSKASFLDNEFIPVFNKNWTEEERKHIDKTFVGKRKKRGLFRSKNGTIINADLNGAANILRKAIPDAFTKGEMPNFNSVELIKHPDYLGKFVVKSIQKQNKEKQHQRNIEMLTYFHQM